MTRRFVGLMTGTSADGIDAALVRTEGYGEAVLVSDFVHRHESFPPGLAERLLAAMHPGRITAGEIARLSVELGELSAAVVARLLEEAGVSSDRVTAVAFHGQTIAHLPPHGSEDSARAPATASVAGATLQIGDAAAFAERAGIDVIADFRSADVAAGGQGAPLVAWPDLRLFGSDSEERIVLNLGGIANATVLPAGGGPDSVRAFDIGPGCMVIDEVCRRVSEGRAAFDRDGGWSEGGTPCADSVREVLTEHPFFTRVPPRSTGREDFGREFAEGFDQRLASRAVDPAGRVASAVALTVAAVEDSMRYFPGPEAPRRWILCGGGASHPGLVSGIRRVAEVCGDSVVLSDELGIPAPAREAVAFALLAAAREDGVPAALPGVTGASRRSICGVARPAPSRRPAAAAAAAAVGGGADPGEVDGGSRFEGDRAAGEAGADRGGLVTELRNPRTNDLDRLSVEEAFDRIQNEEADLPAVVGLAKGALCRLAERFADALSGSGRVVYVGAGTSGRLGVIDAAECPPTFRTPPDRILGVIAGGPGALVRSVEGAEDDAEEGGRRVRELGVGAADVVIGIAAGGTTPYVHGALDSARDSGAFPALITCVPESSLPAGHSAALVVSLVCGPEVLAGSTRMKAGTVTKMALHRLSTLAMLRLGKVYGNWMVDLEAGACSKLRDRAIRIVADAASTDRDSAREALEAASDVKTAIAVLSSGASVERAHQALQDEGGNLRRALQRLGMKD